MSFAELDFAIFLPIVFALFWIANKQNIRAGNLILLLASFVFYGWWNVKLLPLILSSIAVDYFAGIKIHQSEKPSIKKQWLYISIAFNLGLLGVFKYYDFFVDSFNNAFSLFGSPLTLNYAELILPVGISFYTFQTMSYTIDIYRNRITPTHDLLAFGTFVAFFPQLVAGPIEKAKDLLPQFLVKREFKYDFAVDGLRQILWGLFKKLVIADNCAIFVDQVFGSTIPAGSEIIIALILFTIQIYCDFSGYTDIAIGTAKLFNIQLSKNFNFPYFATNIAEHWRRWHISLTSWFRDYLYYPLGGNRKGKYRTLFNVWTVFLVSGLWHGAAWTYIIWGAWHALIYTPYVFKKPANSSGIIKYLKILFTFLLVALSFLPFRSESIFHTIYLSKQIFSPTIISTPTFQFTNHLFVLSILIVVFFTVEWLLKDKEFGLDIKNVINNRFLRWSVYYSVIISIFLFAAVNKQFIYFQF